jgi:hypothetical protein
MHEYNTTLRKRILSFVTMLLGRAGDEFAGKGRVYDRVLKIITHCVILVITHCVITISEMEV